MTAHELYTMLTGFADFNVPEHVVVSLIEQYGDSCREKGFSQGHDEGWEISYNRGYDHGYDVAADRH